MNMPRISTRHLSVLLLFCLFVPLLTLAQDKYQFTVAQDGTGDFSSVQKAIDACKAYPDKRVTILVKNGIYREKVLVPGCNNLLTIRGEDRDKTVITFDDFFSRINRGRNSTFYTASLKVEADDFVLENITVENSAGPVGQALALHVEGDRCVFRNCRFLGNQDTVYLAGRFSRNLFRECYVEGTTDFIFGEATALFEECTVHSKGDSFITAPSTTPGKPFGFVFLRCKLTAAEGIKSVFLARPWRSYAKVAWLYCDMGPFIRKEGWNNWSNPANEKTAFFAEYRNQGPGAATEGRAAWAHILSDTEAANYTPARILEPIGWEKNLENNWTEPNP